MTVTELKAEFERSPNLKGYNSGRLASRLRISVEEVVRLRSELSGKKSGFVRLAEENGIKPEQILGGWLKQKGEPSVNFSLKFKSDAVEDIKVFKEEFEKFLKEYKPSDKIRCRYINEFKGNGLLLINKQDSHLNKFDILGNNDIEERFEKLETKIQVILTKTFASRNIEKIMYILGSDLFNSEWNSETTKGTPQQNIGTMHEGFEAICNHEIRVINTFLEYSKELEVMYCPGNHCENQSWFLMKYLQAYYKNNDRVKFDVNPAYIKYIKYGKNGLQFAHGDGVRPKGLAAMFPLDFKKEWSNCEHFYGFTGDKHVEKSEQIGGIQYYQIPAFSNAVSSWDSKNGYKTKGELTAFFIDEKNGLTDVMKELL